MIGLDRDILKKLSIRVIEMINEQIRDGIDIDGRPYEYSSRPFVRPSGGMSVKGGFRRLAKEGRMSFFKTRKGSLWVLVHKGYKDYRQAAGRDDEGDFLQWSGRMLASMTSRPFGDSSIIVGFDSAEEARKAFWLNFSGVGRSRKLWKFLGLTKDNELRLMGEAADMLVKSGLLVKQISGMFNFHRMK